MTCAVAEQRAAVAIRHQRGTCMELVVWRGSVASIEQLVAAACWLASWAKSWQNLFLSICVFSGKTSPWVLVRCSSRLSYRGSLGNCLDAAEQCGFAMPAGSALSGYRADIGSVSTLAAARRDSDAYVGTVRSTRQNAVARNAQACAWHIKHHAARGGGAVILSRGGQSKVVELRVAHLYNHTHRLPRAALVVKAARAISVVCFGAGGGANSASAAAAAAFGGSGAIASDDADNGARRRISRSNSAYKRHRRGGCAAKMDR